MRKKTETKIINIPKFSNDITTYLKGCRCSVKEYNSEARGIEYIFDDTGFLGRIEGISKKSIVIDNDYTSLSIPKENFLYLKMSSYEDKNNTKLCEGDILSIKYCNFKSSDGKPQFIYKIGIMVKIKIRIVEHEEIIDTLEAWRIFNNLIDEEAYNFLMSANKDKYKLRRLMLKNKYYSNVDPYETYSPNSIIAVDNVHNIGLLLEDVIKKKGYKYNFCEHDSIL